MGGRKEQSLKQKESVVLLAKDHQEKVENPTSAVMLVEGWALPATSFANRSLARELCASFPGKRVITVSTKPTSKQISFSDEVTRLKQFVQDEKITNLTLIGYSEAATKTISLVRQLEEDPKMQIEGLVLCAPLGLHDRSNHLVRRLLSAMFIHIPANTIAEIAKDRQQWPAFGRALKTGIGVFGGVAAEVSAQRRNYFPQLKHDVSEMLQRNTDLDLIRAPIAVVTGANDTLVGSKDIEAAVLHEQQKGREIAVITQRRFGNHGLPFVEPKGFVENALAGLRMARLRRPSGVNAGRQ